MWHILPVIPFSIINNISISVSGSNFTFVIFMAACHANLGGERNEQDQAHIFQDTCFESLEIHHLTIMYHFEHVNHDNPLNCQLQNLYKLFLHAPNLYQQCLPHLGDCKNLLFQAIKFHWIFPNQPYIVWVFATIK